MKLRICYRALDTSRARRWLKPPNMKFLEETGLTVEVGTLLAVHEYQPSKRIDTSDDTRVIYVSDTHRVDTMFECRVIGDTVPYMNVALDNLHT